MFSNTQLNIILGKKNKWKGSQHKESICNNIINGKYFIQHSKLVIIVLLKLNILVNFSPAYFVIHNPIHPCHCPAPV